MNVSAEFCISDKDYVPVGSSKKFISVRDKDVNGLIEILKGEEINIDEDNSEKVISYSIRGMKKTSEVPFDYSCEDGSVLVGYVLRDRDFELRAEDYLKIDGSTERRPESNIGGGVRVGGNVNREGGIKFSLKYNSEMTDIDAKYLERLVTSFYRGSPEEQLARLGFTYEQIESLIINLEEKLDP